jgi:predicted amidohydrolase
MKQIFPFVLPVLFLFPGGQVYAQLDTWQSFSARPELAPGSSTDSSVLFSGRPTLSLSGNGNLSVNGCWIRTVTVEPETYYRFRSHFRFQKVDDLSRSVLAHLRWLDSKGEVITPMEYPATVRGEDPPGWRRIEQIYRSPKGAVQARLELVYRWDSDGRVWFEPATLEKTGAPQPRPVRMATVKYRPPAGSTTEKNLEGFAKHVAQAAAQKADIVCLPEGITMVSTAKSYRESAEPVPGPTTEFLGNLARTYRMYIVAGITERERDTIYNTAVLLDRNGKLAGTYRKVCLPREEIDGGVTPGEEFRAFDTDFGRIGIMICWDVAFPEPARQLMLEGAEAIFMPIWGGNTTLARARAIENQVYLVSSSYDMETGIFGLEGELMAEASEKQPVVTVEVDLGKKKDWWWLGDFENRIPREFPPKRTIRGEK